MNNFPNFLKIEPNSKHKITLKHINGIKILGDYC